MKRKYYVTRGFSSNHLRIGTKYQLQMLQAFPVCSEDFKELAGFLPKKGEMIPIDIKITKRKE